MKYLQFNNHSSADFRLGILSVSLGVPSPNLIIEKLPYCNGSFDFSTVATGGLMTYSDRVITIDFNYIEKNQTNLYETFSKVSSWLLSGPKGNLTFNYINGFYTGRCTQISDLKTFILLGKFTATFTCDPFLDSGAYGDWLWNPFNLETGIAEVSTWTVNTNDIITIINETNSVIPTINSDKEVTLMINSKAYKLNIGDNKLFGLVLFNGENDIRILDSDNATLKFNFRKEYI
ncbi:hypothetical protein [uncultured Clostridium sp.]|jgi:phage-related protein|uniref:hypothetical protein n=1 Tax=uncultured Clostridium sp. TaxID=59620 RepID=UPI00260EEB6D|nr:hypothetical protein [uncultured Clostridium sp.]